MKKDDRLLKICEEVGVPFYLYDRDHVDANIRRFSSMSYSPTSIRFASMANDNPTLLALLRHAGFGLFVNSLKHLSLGQTAGFNADEIVFASTGISERIMERLVERGIWVNLDSTSQVSLFGRVSPGGRAGLRLNIDERSRNNVFVGAESRIGVMESEMDEAFAIARQANVVLTGPHVYLGTDVTDLDDLVSGIDRTIELSERFDKLEFIDLGGGFPIDPQRFDFAKYDEIVSERMRRLSARRGHQVRLVLEPGRSMFGDCASFFAQITDIKERPDRWIICTNASAALIPRAMFYEDFNPISSAFETSEELFDKPADVVGATTYSRDFMARNVRLPRLAVGDWLRFDHAGSYCYSMITRFLGQDLPPEYMLERDHISLIRQGENFLLEMA